MDEANIPQTLTDEGSIVIKLSKALFDNDIDAAFRVLGDHMDQHDLKVSSAVIEEYFEANRVRSKPASH